MCKIIIQISLLCNVGPADISSKVHWLPTPKMADAYLYKNFWSIFGQLWSIWLLKWVKNNTQQSYQSILSNVEIRGFSWVYFWCKKYPKIWSETLAQVWTRSRSTCRMQHVDLNGVYLSWGTPSRPGSVHISLTDQLVVYDKYTRWSCVLAADASFQII